MDIIPMDDSVFERRYFQYIQRCETIVQLRMQKMCWIQRIFSGESISSEDIRNKYDNHEFRYDLEQHIRELKRKKDIVGVHFWRIVQSGFLEWSGQDLFVQADIVPIIKIVQDSKGVIQLKVWRKYEENSFGNQKNEWNEILRQLCDRLQRRYPEKSFTFKEYNIADASR